MFNAVFNVMFHKDDEFKINRQKLFYTNRRQLSWQKRQEHFYKRSIMNPLFLRDYHGQDPFFEVYFGKVHFAQNRALWFRYTILNGVVSEAATWAVVFSDQGVIAEKKAYPIEELQAGNKPEITRRWGDREELQVFQYSEDLIGASTVRGSTGRIKWSMHFKDAGDRYVMIPPNLTRFGIVKTAYRTPFAYARFRGEIEIDGEKHHLQDSPGMIGHISGSNRRSTLGWAWGHACTFDNASGIIFEALSGQLRLGKHRPKPVTSAILFTEDHVYRFNKTRHMFRSSATILKGRWEFSLRSGSAKLSGSMQHPDEKKIALLTYTDTDGSNMWCHNSKLSTLQLHLQDEKRGVDRYFTASNSASFEIVNRIVPNRVPDIE